MPPQNLSSLQIGKIQISYCKTIARVHLCSLRCKSSMGGKYPRMPVLGISIDKESGGERLLGIPIVIDRLIQPAIHQVLGPEWDSNFSEFS
jgi:hypothetical protein